MTTVTPAATAPATGRAPALPRQAGPATRLQDALITPWSGRTIPPLARPALRTVPPLALVDIRRPA